MEWKAKLINIPECRHQQKATTFESLVSAVGSEVFWLHGQSHYEARVVLCQHGRRTREHLPLRFSYPLLNNNSAWSCRTLIPIWSSNWNVTSSKKLPLTSLVCLGPSSGIPQLPVLFLPWCIVLDCLLIFPLVYERLKGNTCLFIHISIPSTGPGTN